MAHDVTRSTPRAGAHAVVLGGLFGALAACQPTALPAAATRCTGLRPQLDVVVVDALICDARIPPLGEGDTASDVWLANHQLRVVVRHPQDALTVRGVGGATIVDASQWSGVDTVHEIVPIVRGGWLTDITVVPESDGLEVSGVVAALSDLEGAAVGEPATVRYRLAPDTPALIVEGADGFRIHPLGDEVLYGGLARTPGRVVGAVGEVVDHGGQFDVFGTDTLWIGADADVWGALAGDDGTYAAGRAPEAEEIALLRDGAVVGRVSILAPEFRVRIPRDIDGVRSEAAGHAPSEVVPPSGFLDLALGGEAYLDVSPVWDDGRPHTLRLDWVADDGRSGRTTVGPDGAIVPLGAGTFDVAISAGPAFQAADLHVELRPGTLVSLPVRLPTRIDAGSTVLAGFRRPADRSPDWRGGDLTAALLAAADGLSYATFTPSGDVGDVTSAIPGFPTLEFRNGLLREGDGYSVAAWPWSSSDRKSMHGAPLVEPRVPLDEAMALATGRTLNVDLGWLAAVGPPPVPVQPDQVWLAAPDADLASWGPWFAWLDRSRPVIPTGPYTWVAVEDPLRVGTADVEQSLARGDVCAGNGPRLVLRVDGVPPGEQAPPATGPRIVTVGVAGLEGLVHLALVTDGGRLEPLPVVPLQTVERTLDGRWVAVAAWSDDPAGPWAVTGPLWLAAP